MEIKPYKIESKISNNNFQNSCYFCAIGNINKITKRCPNANPGADKRNYQ